MLGRAPVAARLLAVVMVLTALSATAVSATAQVPGGGEVASVNLTEVTPAALDLGDSLTLSGTLTNTGDGTLTDPLPTLRWSTDPLQSLDDLALAAANPLFRYGQVDYRYSDRLPSLAPGDTADFSITVPLSSLFLRSGVYVVGVDVLASLPDGLRVFVTSGRTTVPVSIDVDEPLPVSLVWPLAAEPTVLPGGRLLDDSLAAQIAPDGRLTALIAIGDGVDVSWVLDPDLGASAAAMVGGYETASGAQGSGAADAARFVSDLSRTLSAASDVSQVPAADPDVGGAQAAGLTPSIVSSAAQAVGPDRVLVELVGQPLPRVAHLVGRPVTDAMLATYAQAGVGTATLDGSAVTGADGPRGRLTLADGTTVDVVLADSVPDSPSDVAAPLAARQWMLSATAIRATGPQAASGQVVAPPLRWDTETAAAQSLVDAWQGAAWVDPVPLDALPTSPGDTAVALRDSAEPAAMDDSVVAGLTSALADAERLQPLFADPALDPADAGATIARAASHAWQQNPDRGRAYVEAVGESVTGVEGQLSLVLSPSITLSSRSGRFPVTLVNDSTADVVVGVEFTSQNSTRLRVESIEPVLLTSGEKRTFTAVALATANGRVQLVARLVTTEGDPVAEPAASIVDVTNAGALGWTVIAAGAGLFIAALVRARLRARAGRGRREGKDSDDEPSPSDGTESDEVRV